MKNLLCLCFLLLAYNLAAQSISVASFSMLENDLTANTEESIVYDQNGDKCALIKVETTQTDFSFDAGQLGIVKTEQHTAEIWLYVPAGVKRITISHQQFGVLRDYELGLAVKKAKTYLLKLREEKNIPDNKDSFLVKKSENNNNKSSQNGYHLVKSGDTLSSIARKYNLSVSRLCRLNGIRSDKTLQEGQRIKLY